MGEQRQVRVVDLVFDRRFQPRVGVDEGLVTEYRGLLKSGVQFDPLEVFILDSDEEERLYVVDGWHRGRAYEREGVSEVLVDLRRGTVREAVDAAWYANLRHGRPLTPLDREQRARELFGRNREDGLLPHEWSCRDLAPSVGVSHDTMNRWFVKWAAGEVAGRRPASSQTSQTPDASASGDSPHDEQAPPAGYQSKPKKGKKSRRQPKQQPSRREPESTSEPPPREPPQEREPDPEDLVFQWPEALSGSSLRGMETEALLSAGVGLCEQVGDLASGPFALFVSGVGRIFQELANRQEGA